MSKEIAIEVKNLSKHFRLPTEQSSSIKQTFVNRTRGVKGYKEQKVLRDISFNVEKGDFFGIVGRNGSGKSTLLKLISGIYEPDGGSIKINGSLVSFIELGVGFNGELTGRENVYLNGALLGFSVQEIDEMYDEIVEFAELKEFMDQKLKNYSSGMKVRLAFSCAIRAKSDILVLDEVLAVGDADFQRKCYEYFSHLRKYEQTVVLVTHSMDAVQNYCNKAILLEDGKITESRKVNSVANKYLKIFTEQAEQDSQESERWGSMQIKVTKFDAKLNKKNLSVDMNVTSNITCDNFIIAIRVFNIDGTVVAGISTRTFNRREPFGINKGESKKICFTIPNNFGKRSILIGYHIVSADGVTVFDSWDDAKKLKNPREGSYYSIIYDEKIEVKQV